MTLLRITVELVPHGDEDLAEVLSTTYVANTLTGHHFSGDYAIFDEDPRDRPAPRPVGYVHGWRRVNADGTYSDVRGLASIALAQASHHA